MASTPSLQTNSVQSTVWEVRESATSGALLNAAYVVLCLLSLLPFLLIANPPIVDFANHAARLSLACSIHEPAVAAMYQYQLGVIPNLAADIVNVPLCGAVGPAAVLKVLIAASLAAIYFSGWLIQRRLFGRPNAFLLLLPAIAFNLVTTMGYINFLAGIAVACLLIAALVGRDPKSPSLIIICNAAGLVIFFCHIFALAFAMIYFFGRAMRDRAMSIRNCTLAALQTAVLFVVPLLLVPLVASSGEELSIDYFGKWRVLASLFVAQHPNPNIFGSLLLIPIYLLLRRGWIEIHPEFRAPLIALAIYVLIVPSGMRDAIDIDSRSAVPLAYLFFASLRPMHPEAAISAVTAAASALLLGFGLLMSFLVWLPFSREVDEFRAATSVLPPGAPVISVRNDEGDKRAALPLAYIHLASYATIERRIFNPNEFTGVGMQPLSVTPRYASIDTIAAVPVTSENAVKLEDPTLELQEKAKERNAEFMIRWQDRFEYVIYYHFGGPPNFDPKILSLVHQGSFFSILKVKTYRDQ
jgi:hypothetical protein